MDTEDNSALEGMSPNDMNDIFGAQSRALYVGVQAFTPHLEMLHADFENELYSDWPTVLLSTIQHTTAVSLFKLLPPLEPVNEPVDCRSIASLIRNMVDTFDSLDFLCNSANDDEFNLHRDILGHYLAGQTHAFRKRLSPDEAGATYDSIRSNYWKKIDSAIDDKQQKNRIRRGQSLFYNTRRDRLENACGEHSDFVSAVLIELSTYVHSIPPSLWMQTLDEGFLDTPKIRGILGIWLQVANFYYARSIRVIAISYSLEPKKELATYLGRFEHVFST